MAEAVLPLVFPVIAPTKNPARKFYTSKTGEAIRFEYDERECQFVDGNTFFPDLYSLNKPELHCYHPHLSKCIVLGQAP